jgi:hypothetical protein
VAIEENIHSDFRRLQEVLRDRETELASQLDQMTRSKLKSLAAQKDQIETTLAQLNSCLHFMKESIRPGNEDDVLVLMMRRNTVQQVQVLTAPLAPKSLEPCAGANTIFSALAELTAECQNYMDKC